VLEDGAAAGLPDFLRLGPSLLITNAANRTSRHRTRVKPAPADASGADDDFCPSRALMRTPRCWSTGTIRNKYCPAWLLFSPGESQLELWDGIVRFTLRFPHTFYVMAIATLFLGASAVLIGPRDIFLRINIPVVTWQYTGLTPDQMEQRVTTYSEYSISSSVNSIRNIESQTLTGSRSRRSSFNLK